MCKDTKSFREIKKNFTFLNLKKSEGINLSKHVILGQEAGSLPIHDLNVGFLGWMDVELVEDHYLFVPSGAFSRSAVVSYPDDVSGLGEGVPGDVEPAGARQQLVGVRRGLEEIHEALELSRVARADVGSLAEKVLRVTDTTHEGIDSRVAEAGVNKDGTGYFSGRLQEHQTAVGHVRHVLHGGFIVRVFAHVDEFVQLKVRR